MPRELFTISELSSMNIDVKADLLKEEINSIGVGDFYDEAVRKMEKYRITETEVIAIYQKYIEEVFRYNHERYGRD